MIPRGMPPVKSLMSFAAVMETGNFARAAEVLNVTPSAISHQIRALEDILGKRLFARVRRTVTPTEDAVAYAASISESFARIAMATNRLTSGAGIRQLAIHSSPSFAALWLMPRLPSFLEANPDTDVLISTGHEPAKLGEDGFMMDIQFARPIPESCDGIVLAEEVIVPLASREFVARHCVEKPEDIGRVPLIHSIRCLVQWDQWIARHAKATMPIPRGLHVDRAHLALSAAADGQGLALESSFLASELLKKGQLVMPFGVSGVTVTAHRLVHRREDHTSPQVHAFKAWIVSALAADLQRPVPTQ